VGIRMLECYPGVVAAHRCTTLYFRFDGDMTALPEMKLQPMESYVDHAPDYTSKCEGRYPWVALRDEGDGLYSAEASFEGEQRYSVRVRVGEEAVFYGYVYAVASDLAALRPYKGDTHLHTNRSDGWEEPFDTVCAYRAAGYDFVAITDHGRYYPSVDTRAELAPLTDRFHVMLGEEVHPKGGSYFHIISLDADRHVTEVFEQRPAYVQAEIQRILDTRDLSELPDPYAAAMRIFITSEIRAAGGIAVMAHPFWEIGDEYNMQTAEFFYHWRHGDFDALELLAGCDDTGNGNNLQELLWNDLRAEGLTIPIVGASDCHVPRCLCDYDHFNRQFTLVFAADTADLSTAIREQRAVAVNRASDKHFRCIGPYRYAKYARFLMAEYYPARAPLDAAHAEALAARDTAALAATEADLAAFDGKFFGI